METREIRSLGDNLVTSEDSRSVEGMALVFDSLSQDLGGFREKISPSALDGVLERSDVLALLNHDRNQGILAVSIHGEGNLTLEKTETGLRYSFEAPNTPCGDRLVEELRNGNIKSSSFAFSVQKDSWEKTENGYIRTIEQFGELFDVSPVNNPAYTQTECALRSLEEYRSLNEKEETEEVKEDIPVVEETQENIEENEPEKVEETPVQEEENRQNKDTNKKKIMSNFSLIKAINNVVNQRAQDEEILNVIARGQEEMRKSGMSYSGQIQLGSIEKRAENDEPAVPAGIVATVETYGAEAVATEKMHILEPLRNKMVLAQAGATYIDGLVGNVSIPSYTGTTAYWKGELETIQDGKGTFDTIELTPHRLSATIVVSKQFLTQDSVGAEEMLRADIVNALADKLEATILGTGAGDANTPAGIFNGATKKAVSYATVLEMEQAIEEAKLYGDKTFILSPKAKTAFKQATISGSKSDLRILLDGGEIDGIKAISTGNSAGYALGNFENLLVASWGALDIVIDPFSMATENAVRIVVNAFYDCKVRRENAIVAHTLPTE